MAMITLQCPVTGCEYTTPESTEHVACTLLSAHSTIHVAGTTAIQRGPKLERPRVDVGISQEDWNVFKRRWEAFVQGSALDPASRSTQLFQCAGETLGDRLLKSDPEIVSKPVNDVLAAMKSLAVIAVAKGVIRADLMSMRQDRDEQFRSFAARVRGKAETCEYTTTCTCARVVDFTDTIIRDVLISGINDCEIRREILGTTDILTKPINTIISLVEGKEMARNALPSTSGSISSFRRQKSTATTEKLTPPTQSNSSLCPDCGKAYAPFSEGRLGWNKKPHRQCIDCYRLSRNKRRLSSRGNKQNPEQPQGGTAGAIFAQVSTIHTTIHPPNDSKNIQVSDQSACHLKHIIAHNIFSKGQWRRSRFMNHPRVQLELSVEPSDYHQFGHKSPNVNPIKITALADSGAQSCLWSLQEFLAAGFTTEDLIPVSIDLVAANKSPISIEGCIFVRLNGTSPNDDKYDCATMVYISKQANGFYLSMEAMMDLAIISRDFPNIGFETTKHTQLTTSRSATERILNAGCTTPPTNQAHTCSCPQRTVVPKLPTDLPFECKPENNAKMKEWLLEYFASSTFNTCPHRPLPQMTGPPVEIHLKEDATPKAVHTPAKIPIHWQEQVRKDLLRDEALGVIERVPYGEPVTWCHRMVVTRKHDGTPRRTVDLSPLNKYCKRETFASESPFNLARRIPPDTWKTVSDAWNGFHSVPLRQSDRHLTTFITPFGRWRYCTTPQGFVGSGDGYNRRFDAILADFERKERVTDDTIHYDSDLRKHWWRTIHYLIRIGQSGIVLNPDKFQFACKTVDFAGFRISNTSIEPLPKYVDAIRKFPTPQSTTDIRSWFGLINQVSNYAQLRDIMAPFKPFLSPKYTFQWTPELNAAFISSKDAIIDAIKQGVEIFDPSRRTCLRPDWSQQGIGYFLLQKHCSCDSSIPECCATGWKIVLAGSRFLSSTEKRYAPIEGECLAVVWGLEQTKYFTQGCTNLLVVTDHKPLVKILGDRTLDEISNTRIFRLKQRTLPWCFEITHLPGKNNAAADATSRHPSATYDSQHEKEDYEHVMAAAIRCDAQDLINISWEMIAAETIKDPTMHKLQLAIKSGFQNTPHTSDIKVSHFLPYRESLHILDDVILYKDRVIIPPVLRNKVLQILHSAHQGVSAMESRARAIVFWPGMTKDIQLVRDSCMSCNRNAPSQAATPSVLATVPSTPFESIFADFFDFGGCHYLLAGDRLSGWVEVFKAPHSTSLAGAKGLIAALRIMFATFGVPEVLSSDGGPEFSATATSTFLKNWGVHHRISSAHFPQSNGRAEVAVKKCKRLLMDNVSPNGSLDNDKFLRALLQIRNTPDPDCNISPAEIIFGRPLRDAFSFINRKEKFINPSIRPSWREAWQKREDAMRVRFSRTSEKLNLHARPLPPLVIGDRVFLQNQQGHHPNKWDRSGVIMELGDHDQYIVKVDGSGRLTLRNRRFLRKFTAPSTTIVQSLNRFTPRSRPEAYVQPQSPDTDPPVPSDVPLPISCAHDDQPLSPIQPPSPISDKLIPSNNVTPPLSSNDTVEKSTPEQSLAASRPRRNTRPPATYVPETGKWEHVKP